MRLRLLFLFIAISFTSLSAQIDFTENLVIDDSLYVRSPRASHSGDLDGDGDLDIITASYSDNFIAWFENLDGTGTEFIKHTIAANILSPIYITSEDLDNDGDLDVIVASFSDNYIKWFENIDGNGNFEEQQSLMASEVSFVKAEDINNDGFIDIIWSSKTNGKIEFFANTDGLGTFNSDAIIIEDDLASVPDFYVVDVDGDNDMDIISSYAIEGGSQGVTWYRNEDGLGNFGEAIIVNANVNGISSVYAGDLDGDGNIDIATTSLQDGKISLYKSVDGLGTFNPEQVLYTFEEEASQLQIADLDDDNDLDIIAISATDDKVIWLENTNGIGDFSDEIVISSSIKGLHDIHISDMDSDGDIDFIISQDFPNDIRWFENYDGFGNFASHTVTKYIITGTAIFVADLDGDSDEDIISSNNWGNKLAWYENKDGLGNFYNTQQIVSELITRPLYIDAGDLDNDGDNDIVVTSASQSVGRLVWLENVDGLGNFGDPQPIGDNSSIAFKPYIVDIDSDGNLDVAIHGNDEVLWYKNLDGSGTFSQEGQVIIPYWDLNSINSIQFGDIDGDNDMDIVLGRTSGVRYYINSDGQGNFASPTNQNQINGGYFQSRTIKIVDLDGDGDNDIVFSWTNSSTGESIRELAWFENLDGLASFSDVQQIAVAPNTGYVDIGLFDIDADGDKDIICAETDGNDGFIAWYENVDSQGDFSGINQVIALGLGSLYHIIPSDINQDNSLDIVSLSHDKILWLEHNGIPITNEINGKVRFDVLGDGCTEDEYVNGVMIVAEGDLSTGATFSQNEGQFRVFTTNEGIVNTQIASQLPNYYQVTPESFQSDFTGFGNVDQVDFCIEPIGEINDLSISIYPFSIDPRPGFDTSYRLVYRNNGTTQLSGTITFQFDDTKIQFLSANQDISSQTANTITFDFTELNPFEIRVIELEFNVYPPPTTNIDDILVSTATINPISGDETEDDNIFLLEQTVIGSYDPNDIRVLQGNQVLIEDSHKYLNYLIRFQNTGTASAINVRVEHSLDDKLDWSTMKLEDLSHSGRVEIVNGSLVNFIFDNIQLPDSTVNEPESHGFIAYKIKPKPNIEVNDVVSGVADIYFDFNPPIITNTVNTEFVDALGSGETELNVSLFPNPTSEILEVDSNLNIDRLSLYDTNGRRLLIIKALIKNYPLDVSRLSNGIYFLEIQSGNSKSTKKFVKN